MKLKLHLRALVTLCFAIVCFAGTCDECGCVSRGQDVVIVDCTNLGFTQLPTDIPNTTEQLLLGNNGLSGALDFAVLNQLSSLQALNLNTNLLSNIDGLNLPNLIFLDVSNNGVRSFSDSTFENVASLTTLHFGGASTSASTLPAELLQPLVALEHLTISRMTRLSSYPTTLLEGLTNLKTLTMDGNRRISTLPPMFQSQGQLESLSILGGSLLRTFMADTFSGLSKLTSLVINRGRGVSLPGTVFAPLTALKTLELSNMQLQSVPDQLLSALSMLEDLSLRSNSLRTIPAGFFVSSTRVVAMDLSLNQLQGLLPGTFSPLTSLSSLDLSNNGLTEDDLNSINGSTLRELRLDENSITRLSSGRLESLKGLQILSVNSNGLTTLEDGSLNGLVNLKTLNLIRNDLVLTEGMFNNLTQLQTLSLDGCDCPVLPDDLLKGLTNLDTFSLSQTTVSALPPGLFSETPSLRVLVLQALGLPSIPDSLFHGLSKLEQIFLNENSLTELTADTFVDQRALRTLDLSQNALSILPEDVFQSLQQLQLLKLDFNMLTSLPDRVFVALANIQDLALNNNGLTAVAPTLFQGLIRMTKLNLDNNEISILPVGAFSSLPELNSLSLSSNRLRVIQRGAFSVIGRQTFESVLTMDNNPSTCAFVAIPRGSAFAELTCNCADSTTGDGTFCEERDQFSCLPGFINGDNDTATPCTPCGPGTFSPYNFPGTECPPCRNGTIDHDNDSASPCLVCVDAGLHVPEGSVGQCSDFECPTGTFDHDNNAATPCRSICSVCTCEGQVVSCSGLGLETFPRGFPQDTTRLDLANNEFSAIDVLELQRLTTLRSVNLRGNNVEVVDPALARLASRNIEVDLTDNPSSCMSVNVNGGQTLACFCTSGFGGDGTFCEERQASACVPGFVDRGDGQCVFCSQFGLFVPAGSFGTCQSFLCPVGTSDVDLDPATPCVQCPSGSFVPVGSSTLCEDLKCPAGSTDADADPSTPCVRCAPGQFTSFEEDSFGPCSQHVCPAGTVDHDANPETTCVQCPPGGFILAGSFGPCSDFVCQAGEVDHDLNPITPCQVVRRGHFVPANSSGDAIRFQCELGFIDDDFDSTTPCVACPPGSFVPAGSAGDCSNFACVAPEQDVDNDPSTPCSLPTATRASDGISSGALAGIIIGLLALLLLLLFLLNRHWKKKHKLIKKAHNFAEENSRLGLGEDAAVPREIPRNYIQTLEKLGAGAFGVVHKGLLNEYTSKNVPSYLVALKTFDDLNERERQAVYDEAAIMAQINDPNVVSLIGVVTKGSPTMIVLQFCEHGSLDSFLNTHGEGLLLNARCQLAYNIACGMCTLLEHNIIHRDLAARNVLVSSDMQAKVADFGLARDLSDSEYYTSKGGQIAVRWTAPEALEGKKYSEKSDVWSFGVTAWEIWTNAQKPYSGKSNTQVWLEVKGGKRLSRPTGCPVNIYAIMKECWCQRPADRLSFQKLRHFFMQLLNGDSNALARELKSHRNARKSTKASSALGRTLSDVNSAGSFSMSMTRTPSPKSSTTTPAPPSDYVDFGANDLEEAPQLFVPAPNVRTPSASPVLPTKANGSPLKSASSVESVHDDEDDEIEEEEVEEIFEDEETESTTALLPATDNPNVEVFDVDEMVGGLKPSVAENGSLIDINLIPFPENGHAENGKADSFV